MLPTAEPTPTPAGDAPPRATVIALHDRGQAGRLSRLATLALLAEVELSPKPGLVDPVSCGAHDDMDAETFRASITAIAPWFPVLHETGRAGHRDAPSRFLQRLRRPGMGCEDAMFAATRGVNTHKGAVFAFGLLLGCAGRLAAGGLPVTARSLTDLAARMARPLVEVELPAVECPGTYGEAAFVEHRLAGARGEAAGGYASVRRHALPAYRAVLEATGDGRGAMVQALLVLMATTDDTTLVKDGSLDGLRHVQRSARDLLDAGGVRAPDALTRLHRLDVDLTRRGLSPGGCADLLAVTHFLAHLPSGAD